MSSPTPSWLKYLKVNLAPLTFYPSILQYASQRNKDICARDYHAAVRANEIGRDISLDKKLSFYDLLCFI